MNILTKEAFKELTDITAGRCLSIFIPTHRKGKEVLSGMDLLVLKNQLKAIKKEMKDRGYGDKECQDFLKPVDQLLLNKKIWSHQSDGLALFLSNDFMKTYELPINFEPFHYLSNEFYLKPLLPLLVENMDFFLLTLDLHEVKCYQGDNQSLDLIDLEGLLPNRLEEVVGFDYRQKILGAHTQVGGGHRQVNFHGHSEVKEDKTKEILTYLRAINEVIKEHLIDKANPLIISCQDYMFPLYKQVNSYPHLYPKYISGNPKHLNEKMLRSKAFELMASEIDAVKTKKKNLFKTLHGAKRTATNLKEIIPASLNGRVDTLFLDKGYELYGVYEKDELTVRINDEHHRSNVALINQTALAVFESGGQVFLEEKEALPFPESRINALYRY